MQIQLEQYNKISELQKLSSPQILSQINIVDKFEYAKDINTFYAINKDKYSQIYITNLQPRKQIDKTVHLKDCPKILYLQGDPESLIIQQRINRRLNELLIANQQFSTPYLQQRIARRIIWQLIESVNDYEQNGLNYDCISLKNAVLNRNQKWQFSVVGYILQIDKDNPEYYNAKFKNQSEGLSYSFACLFFKLLFGFVPLSPGQKIWNKFQFKNYLNILQAQPSQKLLKIYHFCQRITQISPECQKLLQDSLSGVLKWNDWIHNPYFQKQLQPSSYIDNKKKQILMLNTAEQRYVSLIASAIDYRKKHQLQKLNVKTQTFTNQLTISDLTQKYSWFNYLQVSEKLSFSNLKVNQNQDKQKSVIQINYFNQKFFDMEYDYPIRQLIKFIDKQKQDHPEKFNNQNYQFKLKLYGFPYATAFQLLKIQNNQTPQIKKSIQKAFSLLMQVSALHQFDPKVKLHNIQLKFKSFDEIKPQYRSTLNDLYQFCLNQAMRKYNIKNDVSTEQRKEERKREGLQYYRLCLILLQASLIVRKGGADLHLDRIETASRKQIQYDLNELLQKYFPKKPQFH